MCYDSEIHVARGLKATVRILIIAPPQITRIHEINNKYNTLSSDTCFVNNHAFYKIITMYFLQLFVNNYAMVVNNHH